MVESIQILRQPECDLIVRVEEEFDEFAFELEEIRGAVQAGAHLQCPLIG